MPEKIPPEQNSSPAMKKLEDAISIADEMLKREQERLADLEKAQQQQVAPSIELPGGEAESAESEIEAVLPMEPRVTAAAPEIKPEIAVEDINVKFDLAQKDARFPEFLAKYPDAAELKFEPANAAEVVKRYETFESIRMASEKLNVIYKSELNEKFGIRLGAKGMESIQKYLTAEAIQNPEKVSEFLEKYEKYDALEKQVSELTKSVENLGGEEEQQQIIEQLATASWKTATVKEEARQYIGWKGFLGTGVGWNPLTWHNIVTNKNAGLLGKIFTFGLAGQRTEEESALRTQVREITPEKRLLFFQNLDNQMEALQSQIADVQSLPERLAQVKEFFKSARKDFFMNFEAGKVFAGLVSDRVNRKLKSILDVGFKTKDIKKLEEAQEYIGFIESGAEALALPVELRLRHGKSTVARPLDPEKFKAKIEEKIEKLAAGMLNKKLQEIPIGNVSLDSLYESLKEHLERPTLGLKDKEKTKTFFVSVIEKQSKNLGNKIKNQLKNLDKQIFRVSRVVEMSTAELEQYNKKQSKKSRLTAQEAKNQLPRLMAERERIEREQKMKTMLLSVVVAKLLNF